MEHKKYNLIVEDKNGKIENISYFNDYLLDEDDVINYILDNKIYKYYDIKNVTYKDDENIFNISYDDVVNAFVPEFYYGDLAHGYNINEDAVNHLYSCGYTNADLIKIKNYDECGVVEFVADDDFYIKDNYIITPMNNSEEYERLEQKELEERGF